MRRFLVEQGIPLGLTVVLFAVLWGVLTGEIVLLNALSPGEPMLLQILVSDVLVGLTIYLKTSVDFAIFIGHLMRTHPGWKHRIAIECGTALGNGLGTFVVLALWNLFREIDLVLAGMVFLASLVLLKLAEDGLEHTRDEDRPIAPLFRRMVAVCGAVLARVNGLFRPLLGRIVPHATLRVTRQYSWFGLLFFSGSIPFILGLDDFAGYVPLFSVVHVYGFALGVLAGHLLLNIALFLSPETTIRLVKHPLIAFFGSLAFVGLAIWGFIEVGKIVMHAVV